MNTVDHLKLVTVDQGTALTATTDLLLHFIKRYIALSQSHLALLDKLPDAIPALADSTWHREHAQAQLATDLELVSDFETQFASFKASYQRSRQGALATDQPTAI